GLIKALEDLKLAKNGACNKAGAEIQHNNLEKSDQANAEPVIQTIGPVQATLMGSTCASQKRRKITVDCPM
ncbi:hypothetical protein A2U01_0076267, partial [Trifolium medium]|nr:hypothetical protein [Trifolium medium]